MLIVWWRAPLSGAFYIARACNCHAKTGVKWALCLVAVDLQPVRFAGLLWLKVLFAGLLWKKNTTRWLLIPLNSSYKVLVIEHWIDDPCSWIILLACCLDKDATSLTNVLTRYPHVRKINDEGITRSLLEPLSEVRSMKWSNSTVSCSHVPSIVTRCWSQTAWQVTRPESERDASFAVCHSSGRSRSAWANHLKHYNSSSIPN
jgi:hypothetical protein